MIHENRFEWIPPRVTLSIIGVLVCTLPLLAGLTMSYSVNIEGTYDSNLPQNITGYSGWYAAPSIYVGLSPSGDRIPLSGWVRVNYESYLKERSPILNPSLGSGGIKLELDGRVLALELDVKAAAYYNHKFKLIKLRGGPEVRLEQKVDRHLFFQEGWIRYYDYGDNDDDGLRYDAGLGYEYDFRVLKRHTVMIREAGVRLGVEYNDARSDTSSYVILEGEVEAELKLWELDLSFGAAYRFKKFQGVKEDISDQSVVFYPENTYVIPEVELDIPIWRGISASLSGKYRLKNSTYAPYDYDRYTIEAGLKWHSRVELFR